MLSVMSVEDAMMGLWLLGVDKVKTRAEKTCLQ